MEFVFNLGGNAENLTPTKTRRTQILCDGARISSVYDTNSQGRWHSTHVSSEKGVADFSRKVTPRQCGRCGWPSIRAKILSRRSFPGQCLSTAAFAREVEDQDSGNLTVNHSAVEPFVPPTIDSA